MIMNLHSGAVKAVLARNNLPIVQKRSAYAQESRHYLRHKKKGSAHQKAAPIWLPLSKSVD